MEVLLNSPVLSAFVTGILAIAGTVTVYILSRKKPKKKRWLHDKLGRDALNYPGYEAIIKRLDHELSRKEANDEKREALISQLREKESQLYKENEELRTELSRLKHLRDFTDRACEIVKEKEDK